jgi:hypothetical protein
MKKFLSVILAVLFSLSCFAATGFSQSDCGQACCCSSNMQGMHHTTRLQAPVDSSCCAPTSAHPCGFTKNRNIELPAFTVSAGRINTDTSVDALFVQTTWSSVNDSILPHDRRPAAKIFKQSLPIFLQHNSLLI